MWLSSTTWMGHKETAPGGQAQARGKGHRCHAPRDLCFGDDGSK